MLNQVGQAKAHLVNLANQVNAIQRFNVQEGAALNAHMQALAAVLNTMEKALQEEADRRREAAEEAARKAKEAEEARRRAEGAKAVSHALEKS